MRIQSADNAKIHSVPSLNDNQSLDLTQLSLINDNNKKRKIEETFSKLNLPASPYGNAIKKAIGVYETVKYKTYPILTCLTRFVEQNGGRLSIVFS